jgi:hypothetical protein
MSKRLMVKIVVALISCMGLTLAAGIELAKPYVEKVVNPPTTIVIVVLSQSVVPTTPIAVAFPTFTPQPTYTPYPTFTQPPVVAALPTGAMATTPQSTGQPSVPLVRVIPTIPPTLAITPCKYGVLGQGQAITTLTCPGVCGLFFYPFGGQEKTFVFGAEGSVWVQNYNGTLACWQTTPSRADVSGHPFANLDEVQKAGVVFSGKITPVDPSTLR